MARYVNYNGRRYDLPSDQSGITTKEMVTLERELRVSLLDPDLGDSLGVRLGWAWIVIRRTITGLTLDELYEAVDENRFEFKSDTDDEAVEEDEVPPTGVSEEAGTRSSSSDGESGPQTSTAGSPQASSTGSSQSSRPSGNKRSRRAA